MWVGISKATGTVTVDTDHARSRRPALAIVLAALVVVPAHSQEAGRDRGEKYALLVGVRQYDPNELRPLAYSEPDVVELEQVLKGAGYRRVVLMTQTEGATMYRGGCWRGFANFARSADRSGCAPDYRDCDPGFHVARVPSGR